MKGSKDGEELNKMQQIYEQLIKEKQMTYDVYAEMPDDSQRYEIIDGSLELMSPGPSTVHQTVSGELEYMLKLSCKSEYIILYAPIDVILSQKNVLQPDILMIHRSRLHIMTARGIEGPPDLVVEIISPGSRKRDKVYKMSTYARFSVPEYWIVDTDARTLEQYRLAANDIYEIFNLYEGSETVTSDKLPSMSFNISDIFKEYAGLQVD